ncbi:hypothetical protein GE107_25315 [Cohnella sp. CFH 77786]|jgi:hypothetical protein|uniref:hypothetical protein n=1 Tax=Cohnella sp. CFH 77786 TaxID=2662265 RepID=UPI001C6080B0|nr:hypothetical protein [Cohnella sp. CFH 77786]MBW5449350.1 hypothetical protein [Cohnella sp. CFH 77786]
MAFALLKEIFVQSLKHRTVVLRLSRSDYYKLQMICEALNETVPAEHEVNPEIIGTRVLETFIRESFQDSTNRIVKQVIPEARKRRTAGR